MGAVVTQAHLQRRLLLTLADGPAATATDAAARVGAGRASTSRCLHTLRERSLVEKRGRSWALTAAGHAAAADLATELSPLERVAVRAAEQQERWERGLGHGAAVAVRRLAEASATPWANEYVGAGVAAGFITGAGSAFDMAQKLAGAGSAFDMAQKLAGAGSAFDMAQKLAGAGSIFDLTRSLGAQAIMLGHGPVLESTRLLREHLAVAHTGVNAGVALSLGAVSAALVEAMETQRTQLAALAVGSNTGAWWSGLVAESMGPTSRMLSDLTAMKELLGAAGPLAREFGPLLGAAATDVVTAQRLHLTAALSGLAPAPPTIAGAAIRAVVAPSAGSAASIGAARYLLEPAPRRNSRPDVEIGADTRALAERLEAIHPMLRDELLGAWERMQQGGHDWARAASTSAREVVVQTIERMAPDAPSDPANKNRPSRASRLRQILGSRTHALLVEAHVRTVESAYELLSAESHEREASRVSWLAMVGVLRSAESVLWAVIGATPDDGDDGES